MNGGSTSVRTVGGPFYDDLRIGDRFDSAPAVTLTDGLAASHHAIVGGRLRLAHDHELSARVTGRHEPLAHPGLVWDVAIGQSTLVTERAIANLFYRGLAFRRLPSLGDTLRTNTEIVGLRTATPKPGRPPRGLVVMRIVTIDQDDRPVLDFQRCALLPAREAIAAAEAGQLEPPQADMTASALISAVDGWDLATYRSSVPGPHFAEIDTGAVYRIEGGDVVSSAPELARLTLNLAAIHHDRTAAANGERLVYGGHTIGIAAAQITRALPGLVTILAWQSCDHTGPVNEDDTLHSEIAVERCEPLSGGGGLVQLRSRVRSTGRGGETSDVLDWRLVGLLA
jgi:acyl dehydratase